MEEHVEPIPPTDFNQLQGAKEQTEDSDSPLNDVVGPELEQGEEKGLWNGIISLWDEDLIWGAPTELSTAGNYTMRLVAATNVDATSRD